MTGYAARTSAAAFAPSSTSCSGVYLFFGGTMRVWAVTEDSPHANATTIATMRVLRSSAMVLMSQDASIVVIAKSGPNGSGVRSQESGIRGQGAAPCTLHFK